MQYQRIVNYEKKFSPNSVICHSNRKVFYPNGVIQIHPTIGINENNYSPSGIAVAEELGKPLKDGYGSCQLVVKWHVYPHIEKQVVLIIHLGDLRILRCVLNGTIRCSFCWNQGALVNQFMTNSPDKSIDIEFKYSNLLIKKYENFIKKQGDFKFCLKWLKIKYQFSQGKFTKMTINLIYLFTQNPFETLRRLIISFPRLKLNINFSTFHKGK